MSRIHSLLIPGGCLPIVFIHGLFGQGKNWMSIAKSLTDIGTSLLVDAPNHGRSAWTNEFDYDHMAESIFEEAMAHEQFRNGFAVVGHSMGGKIAMRLALAHPELLRMLTVVDISPIAGHVGSNFGTLVQGLKDIDLGHLRNRAQAERELSEAVPNKVVRDFLLQNLHREPGQVPKWEWRMNLQLLGDSLDLVGTWEDTDHRYPGPVLWLAGERSPYIKPEHVPLMRQLFPRVVLVKVKDAGHWVHSEQPEHFLQALRTFIHLNKVECMQGLVIP